MKRFYFRFRVMLMTFLFGLACVFVIDGSLKESVEIKVELPEFQSDSVIFVTSKTRACFFNGGGSHIGATYSHEFLDKLEAEYLASEAKNIKTNQK